MMSGGRLIHCMLNIRANSWAICCATTEDDTADFRTSAMDVMWHCVKPQGMMWEKGVRSRSTLSANP